MGGQTALNCALDLVREGVLEEFSCRMIGASKEAIDKAEDRELFDKAMKKIGLGTPRSVICHSLEEAIQVQKQVGFPVSSDLHSPLVGVVGVSPTTKKSSRRFVDED